MRRAVGLASVMVLAAGCMGRDSHHSTLSASDALAQARADGFVRPVRDTQPPSYKCVGHFVNVGLRSPPAGTPATSAPATPWRSTTRRVPPGPENVARIAMLVIVFRDAATAAECARAAIFSEMHPTGT